MAFNSTRQGELSNKPIKRVVFLKGKQKQKKKRKQKEGARQHLSLMQLPRSAKRP